MIGVNLLPLPRRLARLRRRRTLHWCVILGAEIAIGLAPVIAATIQSSRLDGLVDQQEALASRMTEARAELAGLIQQNKGVTEEIDRASAFRNKRAWSALLALVGRKLPADVWLESVATDPAMPAAGAAPRGASKPATPQPAPATTPGAAPATESVVIDSPRKLVLKGQSQSYESLQGYAVALQEAGAFQRVTLGRSVKGSGPQGDAYRFEISCEW